MVIPRRPNPLTISPSPQYRKLLVTENPASSSPGLAFMLATIDASVKDGWQDYWQELRKNDVRVDDGWEQAYEADFTAGGGSGDRPLVVSYAPRRPPMSCTRAGRRRRRLSVSCRTCFRQIEFAGVLENAKNPLAPAPDRFHADASLPGRHSAADVRVSGASDRQAADRCS